MEITRERYWEIRTIVEKIYKHCGTRDPFLIAEGLNINCSTISLSGALGISDISKATDKATIYLSSNLDSYAKKIICAHELGHLLLHRDIGVNLFTSDGDKDDIIEYEANVFALELMPHLKPFEFRKFTKEELQTHMEKKITSNTYAFQFYFRFD